MSEWTRNTPVSINTRGLCHTMIQPRLPDSVIHPALSGIVIFAHEIICYACIIIDILDNIFEVPQCACHPICTLARRRNTKCLCIAYGLQ